MAKKHDEKKDGGKAEDIYKYDPEVEAYLRITHNSVAELWVK